MRNSQKLLMDTYAITCSLPSQRQSCQQQLHNQLKWKLSSISVHEQSSYVGQ